MNLLPMVDGIESNFSHQCDQFPRRAQSLVYTRGLKKLCYHIVAPLDLVANKPAVVAFHIELLSAIRIRCS